ncbi:MULTISPECIES: hypothetical protein [unclassified Nocardioides]|uniref:hypothetical protein n=1 Tax=unclassified Nocardioides TaxID=2615069 RepID=UPI0007036561|nr:MULTISPECIES: hypothetical protein [unclassified Nocardioides]KRC58945.1 hypothetical protein ASE19_23085 [Nocardioides sp. Root79]KRC76734.1 hypothetical protein ASE20_00255 [Nocardioides sp. Root240]
MTRPTPRRPATSRGGTQRPRKIAGQAGATRPEDEATGTATTEDATVEPGVRLRKQAVVPTPPPALSGPDEPAGPVRPSVLARQKTTRVLIATLVLVALALGLEAAMLVVDKVGDDDPKVEAADNDGQVTVPDGRPVIADDLDVKEGVDAAAKAAQEIVSVDYKKYDEEVDDAADLMTSSFETQYRRTAGDIEDEFVANKTIVQAPVVAQAVVRANRTRLQALVFLNQAVVRERNGKPETVVTPYKVLVTMVHTDQGWFVDGLDTDGTRDKNN